MDIAVLLAKDAIKPVPPAEMKQGFYSPYFIVPNKKRWSSANPGSVSLESGPSQVQVHVQVELYCHSTACGDIQWNEMPCLTGPRCYINTDIQQ